VAEEDAKPARTGLVAGAGLGGGLGWVVVEDAKPARTGLVAGAGLGGGLG